MSVVGSQPTNLSPPVPTEGEQTEQTNRVQSFFERLQAQQAQTPQAEPQQESSAVADPAESLGTPTTAQTGMPPEVALSDATPVVPTEPPTEQTASFKERLAQKMAKFAKPQPAAPASFFERSAASFLSTNDERIEFLSELHGPENVRMRGGEIEFRRNKNELFTRWDPDFSEPGSVGEVAKDIFADQTRLVVETVLDGALTVVGGAAGITAGSALGPVGSLAMGSLGVGAGRAASATLAFGIAEGIREYALDVEKDRERNLRNEALATAAFGGLFGAVGSRLSRAAAQRAAREATDATQEAITKRVGEIEEAQDLLSDILPEGFSLNKTQVIASQEQFPDQLEVLKMLSANRGFQNMQEQMGKELGEATDQIVSKLTKNHERFDGSDVIQNIKKASEAPGKVIEGFRKELVDIAGDEVADTQNLGSFISEAKQTLADQGIRFGAETLDKEAVAIITGLTEDRAKTLVPQMKRIFDAYENGSQTLNNREVVKFYGELQQVANKSLDPQTQIAVRRMRDVVRDDLSSSIGAFAQKYRKGNAQQYEVALKEYSDLKAATSQVSALLKRNDISADAMSRYVFTKGATGLDRMRATKALMQATDPEAWEKLVAAQWRSMIRKSSDIDSGKLDYKKLQKLVHDFDAGEGKMHKELFSNYGDVGQEQFNALMRLGNAWENRVKVGAEVPDAVGRQTLKSLAILASNTFLNTKLIALESLGMMVGPKKLDAYFGSEGYKTVMKTLSKKERDAIQPTIDQLIAMSPKQRMAILSGGVFGRTMGKVPAKSGLRIGAKQAQETLRGEFSERN